MPDASPLLPPSRPHDDLSFEELSQRYNFRLTSDRVHLLVRLMIKELANRPRPRRVLEVGCGLGMGPGERGGLLPAIREHVEELWGIEPDESVHPTHGLFDRFEHGTFETLKLPEGHFDLIYSHLVMEHVADPRALMEGVARCLKPGGVHMFITPNRKHYFARTAKLVQTLRLDKALLWFLLHRDNYPLCYECNTPEAVRRAIDGLDFEEPEFVFVEQIGPRPYFPGPLALIFHALALKRQLIHNPKCLLDLICRMRKKQ